MKVTISLELANNILGYLGKRPYDEVFMLIEKFQNEHKEALKEKAEAQDAIQEPSTEA